MMILSRTRSSPLPSLVRNLIMKVIYMVMMLTVIVTGDTDTTYSPAGSLEVEISPCGEPETYNTCLYQTVPGLFTTELVGMMTQQPNAQNIKSFLSKGIDVIDECWDCLSGGPASLILFCQGFSYVDRYLDSQVSNLFPDLEVLCTSSVSDLESTTTDTDDESATVHDHGKTEITNSSAGQEDSHSDEVSMASGSSGEIETVITTFDAESSTFEEDLRPDELDIFSVSSSKAKNYNRKLGRKARKKVKDRILLIGIEYCKLGRLQNLDDKYKTDNRCGNFFLGWPPGRCESGCRFWSHPGGIRPIQGCYRAKNGIYGPYCERPDGTVYAPSKVVTGRVGSPPNPVYDHVCASKCPPSALNLTYKCDQVQRLFGCTTNSNVCLKKMWADVKIWTDFLANMYPGKKAISSLNKAVQAGNDVRRVRKLLRRSARAAKRHFKKKFRKQLREAKKEFKEMMKDIAEDISEQVADAFFESILDEVMMEQTVNEMSASARKRATEALTTIVGIFSPLDFEAIKELYWKQPDCKELTNILNESKLSEIEWSIVDNKENVAFGKPTRQSSTFGDIFSSRNAVDGDRDGTYEPEEEVDASPITHTHAQNNPWWEVDLLGEFNIQQINIYNREDCCQDRLRGFRVDILNGSNRVVKTYNHTPGDQTPDYETIINIQGGTRGNKVKVSIPGSNKILSLAEVEVIARV